MFKFYFKKLFVWSNNIAKKTDKEKYVYNGYGMALDGIGEWTFGNDYAGNVIIYGVNNILSSHSDDFKNKFLILGEMDTFGINRSFGAPGKKLVLILVKKTQNGLEFTLQC